MTAWSVEAPPAGSRTDGDVAGRIVLIPSADPGYDWLLARDIAGLITMFGGANSHMAVRAAECSLPAAIGVGDIGTRRSPTRRSCASTAAPAPCRSCGDVRCRVG